MQRSWPTVIGILIIALQALGFLVTLATTASLFMDLSGVVAPFAGTAALESQKAWRTALLVSHLSVALLSLLAIAGGILLLFRRRRGVTILLAWAALRIPHAFYAGWTNANAQFDTMTAMPQPAGRPMPAAFNDMMYWMSFLTSVIWLLVIPTFILIWFLVPPIRRQTRLWP